VVDAGQAPDPVRQLWQPAVVRVANEGGAKILDTHRRLEPAEADCLDRRERRDE